MTSAARVLTTARLTLRPHALGDFEDCAALWADPAVVEHIGGVPSSREAVWSRLLRYGGLWAFLGFGYWCIRDSGSGRFVGEAGLADFHREVTPDFGGAPEAGWALAPWAHGRGYGREAMEAILAWADATLGAERIVCMIDPANAPSIALAGKLGFQALAEGRHGDRPTLLFERNAIASN